MVKTSTAGYRDDRHPSESYEDILERDTRPVPDHLRQHDRWDAGTDAIPVSRFYDPEYFRLEGKHVWGKIWQWACREEEIPNVGDYQIYEILDKSVIVTRTAPGEIKAFYNSCLHRGRKLVTINGCKQEFKCPFHGLTWKCDGSFKENPIPWDFPQWEGKDMSLPQVRVDTWGGFVFVNFDPDAKPLIDFIAPMAEHFERYDYKNRYIAVHIHKIVNANWKITTEAFMESLHVITTHPQIMPFVADANSQYDILNDFVTRQFSAIGVPSPHLNRPPTPMEIVVEMSGGRSRIGAWFEAEEADEETLPNNVSARAFMADKVRKDLELVTGRDHSHASDAEVLDPLLYNIFPHMSMWASYAPSICYRFRPLGTDPERSVMEIFLISPPPAGGERPQPAQTRYMDEHQSMMDMEDVLGSSAETYEQDMNNIPYVQQGLHTSGIGELHYARYSEGRIRHMHHLIHQMVTEGEKAEGRTVRDDLA